MKPNAYNILGRVSFVDKNFYDPYVYYTKLDVVKYGDITYVKKSNITDLRRDRTYPNMIAFGILEGARLKFTGDHDIKLERLDDIGLRYRLSMKPVKIGGIKPQAIQFAFDEEFCLDFIIADHPSVNFNAEVVDYEFMLRQPPKRALGAEDRDIRVTLFNGIYVSEHETIICTRAES